MENFLYIFIISALILFITLIGVIYTFVLFLVNFALCLPINLVKMILYFFKTKNI